MNWSNLKAHVDGLSLRSPFAATWRLDRSKSGTQPNDPVRHAELQFTVMDDTVTIADVVVDRSGREARGLDTIYADGQERASGHEYIVKARWRGAYALEAVIAKAGQEVSRVTYEVSRDGRTLPVSATAAAHAGYSAIEQVSVFKRVAGNAGTP